MHRSIIIFFYINISSLNLFLSTYQSFIIRYKIILLSHLVTYFFNTVFIIINSQAKVSLLIYEFYQRLRQTIHSW